MIKCIAVDDEKLVLVLIDLASHFNNLWYHEDFPTEIHVPAIKETRRNVTFYRPPLGIEETLDITGMNCNTGFWGIKTFKFGLECVYSLEEKKLDTASVFYTEEDLRVRDIFDDNG